MCYIVGGIWELLRLGRIWTYSEVEQEERKKRINIQITSSSDEVESVDMCVKRCGMVWEPVCLGGIWTFHFCIW